MDYLITMKPYDSYVIPGVFFSPDSLKPKRGRAPHAGLPQFAAVALPAAVPEAWSVAPGRSARTIGPLDR